MNTEQIAEMECKLQEMQRELEDLKKEQQEDMKHSAMLPDKGKWYLDAFNFRPDAGVCTVMYTDKNDQNIFPSREIAEAYADAFRVMLELRRCEGSGQYFNSYGEKRGWVAWGEVYSQDDSPPEYPEMFSFCPPFPSEELAQAATDKVGKERIIAAMKLLANVKN